MPQTHTSAELETLCEQARRHRMHVELSVESGKLLGSAGREYRHLERLRVYDPIKQRILDEQPVTGGDVGQAAGQLLERV